MKRKRLFTIAFAAIISVISLLRPLNTFAIKRAFSISPLTQEIILVPGESYRGSIEVTNPLNADDDFKYNAFVGPYYPKSMDGGVDDYGTSDITTITSRNLIMDWIKIDNPSGAVSPNGTASITFTISVPNDAPAGGQYATISVKEDVGNTVSTDGQSNVVEIMQMSSVIFANVAGDTREEGVILENTMPSFLLNSDLEATSLVRNNGNVHSNAEYVLQVWPMFSGEEICTNEEKPMTSMILPDTERYNAQTCKLPPIGVFKAKQVVKIFGEVSTVEKTIIVCPIWLLFLIIFAVIALIICIILRAKNKGKKSRKSDD